MQPKDFLDLRNVYFQTGKKLQEVPGWKESDARVGVFAKCINVIEPTFFALMFEKEQLRTKEYQGRFAGEGNEPPSEEEIVSQSDNFLRYLILCYAITLFSVIESSLRIFVKKLDPTACSNGTSEVQSIYNWLLKQLGLQKYETLLELFRLIRNCMHNNGIFTPKNGQDVPITYKEQDFKFKKGEQILFVTFDFLILLSYDLREMLEDIIKSPKLSAFDYIEDPTFPK